MKLIFSIVLVFALCAAAFADQAQKKSAAPDRLGLTCSQILAMSSADWVVKFTKEKGAGPDETSRALAAYGTCYESRTTHLVSVLAARRKGPSLAARKEFANFDQALKDFTATALTAVNPAADPVRTAYAALYEKQFRYEFYEDFELKAAQSTPLSETKPVPAETAPQPTPSSAATEADPITKAKNHFGELLGVLPEDKIHEVHAAFGKIFASRPVTGETMLAVYRYAIFVLEPPSAQPFSPPPF